MCVFVEVCAHEFRFLQWSEDRARSRGTEVIGGGEPPLSLEPGKWVGSWERAIVVFTTDSASSFAWVLMWEWLEKQKWKLETRGLTARHRFKGSITRWLGSISSWLWKEMKRLYGRCLQLLFTSWHDLENRIVTCVGVLFWGLWKLVFHKPEVSCSLLY